ncbi:glycosyltransferase family 2 protein [Bacteroidota bacterium]
MSSKIGIGIITCNRSHFFKELIDSVPAVEEIVVVNDGVPYSNNLYPLRVNEIIQHKKNKGIARTKNDALRYLIDKSCNHIFLLEDDIAVKESSIFEKYIRAGELSGIYHFNYAYHGISENRTSDGKPNPRLVVDYGDGIDIAFYRNTTAALSYFRAEVLEKVGLIDTFYRNALEHVDHTYQIIKAGYHPPFRWFADLHDSNLLIRELDLLQNESLLKKNEKMLLYRAKFFGAYFRLKNGYRPSRVPSVDEKEIYKVLEQLKTRNKAI